MDIIRESYLNTLEKRVREVRPLLQVLHGPRQIGKTTLALQLAERYGQEKVLYATADLPVPPNNAWIIQQWQQARAIPDGLLILDEIQKVSQWSQVIKMLFDEDRLKKVYLPVLILGSASLQLQDGLSESLLGRYEITQLPHWGYAECLEAFQWELNTYLQFGGYPEPARMIAEPDRWHRFMIDSVIEPILGKDLPTIRPVTKPALLRQTLNLSLSYPAQEISLRKFTGELSDPGSITTIKGYLDLLEGAFLIRLLHKYSTRPLSTRTSSPKILPLCPALISCMTSTHRVLHDHDWRGRVFESVLGARLHNLFRENLWYWRQGNDEVDFVARWDDNIYAIEVKSSTHSYNTSKSNGLIQFKKHFPRSYLIIINQVTGEQFLTLKSDEECKRYLENIATAVPI